jgi:hypothetical protein
MRMPLDPERPVVPDGVDAAVDLRAREDEATALAEADDGVEIADRRLDLRVGGALGRRRLVGHGMALHWAADRGRDGRRLEVVRGC